MKSVLFLCMAVSLQAFAIEGYTQDAKINIHMKGAKIENVLKEIETQSEYRFLYDSERIRFNEITNVDWNSVRVKDALSELFKNKDIVFRLIDKQIVLFPAEAEFTKAETTTAAAQGITVTGLVTEGAGLPMPGVNITIQGTTTGTVTNADGSYSLIVPGQDAVLVFSFIGYVKQEVTVGERTRFDIIMAEDSKELEEVVVVGYGVQKKENLTGAVSQIKGDVMESRPTATAANLLQGVAAGLYVSTSGQGGYPGATSTIRVRNNTSWVSNSVNWKGDKVDSQAPLFVIDGITRDKAAFDNLNPNNIADISVLKDAASASIYGMKAGNGVILVTTKKGLSGVPEVSYNANYSFNKFTRLPELMNAYDDARLVNTALSQMGYTADNASMFADDELEYFKTHSYTVFDNAWQNPWSTNHNLSVSGGGKKINYYVSGSYLHQGGGLQQKYDKYTVLSKVEGEIAKGLSFYLNMDVTYNNNHRPNFPYGVDQNMSYYWYYLYYNLPWYPDFIDGKPVAGGDNDAANGAAFVDPRYMDNNYRTDQNTYFNGIFELKYKLPWVEGLAVKARAGYNKGFYYYKYFNAAMDVYFFKKGGSHNHIYTDELNYSRPGGYFDKNNIIAGAYGAPQYLSSGFIQNSGYQIDLMVTFDRTFGNHTVNAFAAYEPSDIIGNYMGASGKYYDDLNYQELNGASSDPKNRWNNGSSGGIGQASYFGRIDYNYAQKYLLGFTFRADGSMNFAPERRWGYFPAVSAGWNISKENFFTGLSPYIEHLKLRASFGYTGTDNIAPWQWQQTYDFKSSSGALIGNSIPSGIGLGAFANPNVTWEKNANTDIGLDVSMPNKLVTLTLDWWYKKTTDILDRRIASTPVTVGAILPAVNYGEVSAHGFEITVGHQKRIGEVDYFVNANWSYSINKILVKDQAATVRDYQNQIGHPVDGRIQGYVSEGIIRTQADADRIIAEKGPNFTIFGNKPEPGMIMYQDIRGPLGTDTPDGIVDDNDLVNLSFNGSPRIGYGFSAGVSWKGLSVSAIFSGFAKYDVMLPGGYTGVRAVGIGQNNLTMWSDAWTEDNPNASLPAPGFSNKGVFRESSFWLRSGSYLRFKNLTVNYSLPSKWFEGNLVQGVRAYFSGENLCLLWDKVDIYDPELGSILAYPLMKSFTFGINVTF